MIHERLLLPALRAAMGDWTYYIASMTLEELAHRVTTATLSQRTGGSANLGGKTSKVIQDCTICASCRCTGLCWIVPRKRVNRFEWREFASY